MPSQKEKSSIPTNKPTIITIDGPAGAGKSTVAKKVAESLGYTYLDTGAMYRALTLKAMEQNVEIENASVLAKLLSDTNISLKADEKGNSTTFLDDKNVSKEIRQSEVTKKVFFIARAPEVREEMVKLQRRFAEMNNVVVEGRDIGTVVFPNADKKFYLDADSKIRASRRFKELKDKKEDISLKQIEKDVEKRDMSDLTRSVGPLKKADDAIYIDSTNMTIDEVVEEIISKSGFRK